MADWADERAENIVAATFFSSHTKDTVDAVATALRAAREDALEEAAQWHDKMADLCRREQNEYAEEDHDYAASRIRSLKSGMRINTPTRPTYEELVEALRGLKELMASAAFHLKGGTRFGLAADLLDSGVKGIDLTLSRCRTGERK
ncbi:MAG: hypothetical protein AB7F35_29720 [Acetobacteraceae bacterium]